MVWRYREPLVRNEHDGAWTDSAPRNDEAEQAAHLTMDIAIQAYRERIRKIRQLIEAGDLYQANFTVKGSLPCNEPPAASFEKIMASQPVAYGALIHTG